MTPNATDAPGEERLTEIPEQMALAIIESDEVDQHQTETIEPDSENHCEIVYHFAAIDGDGLFFHDHPTGGLPPVFGPADEIEAYFNDKVAKERDFDPQTA